MFWVEVKIANAKPTKTMLSEFIVPVFLAIRGYLHVQLDKKAIYCAQNELQILCSTFFFNLTCNYPRIDGKR